VAKQLFSNGASATLAVSIIDSDLTVQVQAGYGALFPSPTGGDWFMLTLEDNTANIEVMKCTARSGDLLTVQRAQEGTLAQAFTNTVTRCELRDTKGTMERFLQRSGDTLGGNLNLGGYTIDSGALGSNVSIPTDSVYINGMIMLWSGSVVSIPTGWSLCDGTNGTPDLRGRFIVGAGGAYAPAATGGAATDAITTSSEGAHTHSGATGGTSLTVDQMPAHTHNVGYRGSNASSSGADIDFITEQGSPNLDGQVATTSAGSGNAHTHTISSDGAHTHTATVDTLPPYYALCYIMYTG
jgi:microcystin-dependent protein